AVVDRLAPLQICLIGQQHHRHRGARRAASGGRCRHRRSGSRRGRHVGFVLGLDAGGPDERHRQDVVVHEVQDGKDDREIEAIEPPSRQVVVELADAVGLVLEYLVAFPCHACLLPSSSASALTGAGGASPSGSAACRSSCVPSARTAHTSTTVNTTTNSTSENTGKIPTPAIPRRISVYIT